MIVSVHIPKTAGTSFRLALERTFGDRLLLDYDDRPLSTDPDQIARRLEAARRVPADAAGLAARYDVVHGHFIADKYQDSDLEPRFAAFFREPGARLVSHFKQWRRQANPANPLGWKVHTGAIGMAEMAADPMIRGLYRHFLGTVPVDAFDFIGLTEAYERSLALFEAVFGIALPMLQENVTASEGGAASGSEQEAIDKTLLAPDQDVYDQACHRFEALCVKYGV